MKEFFKISLLTAVVLLVGLLLFTKIYWRLSYSDQAKYRKATNSIKESKARGVFVKQLHFEIENFTGGIDYFVPYIEKGFKWGEKSISETRPLLNSKFPYQLTFNDRPKDSVTIAINKEDLKKFDSANSSWGYLQTPVLKDTIYLVIYPDGKTSRIKVWE